MAYWRLSIDLYIHGLSNSDVLMNGGVTNSNYTIFGRCILSNDLRVICALFDAYRLIELPSRIAKNMPCFAKANPNHSVKM